MSSDVIDAGRGDPGRHGGQAAQLRERRDDGFTKRFDEPAGDRGGGLHRDLLTQNCSKAHLESVEGARHSHTGVRFDRCRQTRIPAQVLCDQVGSRVEIEQRPNAPEQRRQHRGQAVRELDHQRVLRFGLRHGDPALRRSQLNGPGIRMVRHEFDTLERARGQEGKDALPVVRRTIRKLESRRLVPGDHGRAVRRLPAEMCRGHPIAPVERVIEPAQAREAAGEGDLGDGQRRLGQELLGEQQPAGQQQLNRRYA